MVTTICYGHKRTFNSHKEAFLFFYECYLMSEGSEQARYAHVLSDIYLEKKVCTDGEND